MRVYDSDAIPAIPIAFHLINQAILPWKCSYSYKYYINFTLKLVDTHAMGCLWYCELQYSVISLLQHAPLTNIEFRWK